MTRLASADLARAPSGHCIDGLCDDCTWDPCTHHCHGGGDGGE